MWRVPRKKSRPRICTRFSFPDRAERGKNKIGDRRRIFGNASDFLAKLRRVWYTVSMMDWSGFSGRRVCAAVSGGIDSMSLLHMLKGEAEKSGFFLSAVNCEHGIRGEESLADTRFVADVCREWGIPLRLFSADCPAEAAREKISLETAARNFRYRSFSSLLESGEADFVATAHHLGDEAETILFRLCRGTSLTGARGMEERNGQFLRPLLSFTRAQIAAYAAENGVPFREDSSNRDLRFTRNKLRLEVLPKLEEAIPGAAENLVSFARLAAEDDDFLYALAAELVFRAEPEAAGDTGMRVRFSPRAPLFRRACLSVLKGLGVERDYTSRHLDGIFSLLKSQAGSRVCLPRGIVAVRGYDSVAFFLETGEKADADWREPFRKGRIDAGRYEIIVSEKAEEGEGVFGRVLSFDGAAVSAGAVFRFRREGDRFEKFGGGNRSLKRYFIDKKIPRAMRGELPVLAGEDGNVYVVCGVEIADRLRVNADTVCPLYLTIRKKRERDK